MFAIMKRLDDIKETRLSGLPHVTLTYQRPRMRRQELKNQEHELPWSWRHMIYDLAQLFMILRFFIAYLLQPLLKYYP
jgi:hypothetical protein